MKTESHDDSQVTEDLGGGERNIEPELRRSFVDRDRVRSTIRNAVLNEHQPGILICGFPGTKFRTCVDQSLTNSIDDYLEDESPLATGPLIVIRPAILPSYSETEFLVELIREVCVFGLELISPENNIDEHSKSSTITLDPSLREAIAAFESLVDCFSESGPENIISELEQGASLASVKASLGKEFPELELRKLRRNVKTHNSNVVRLIGLKSFFRESALRSDRTIAYSRNQHASTTSDRGADAQLSGEIGSGKDSSNRSLVTDLLQKSLVDWIPGFKVSANVGAYYNQNRAESHSGGRSFTLLPYSHMLAAQVLRRVLSEMEFLLEHSTESTIFNTENTPIQKASVRIPLVLHLDKYPQERALNVLGDLREFSKKLNFGYHLPLVVTGGIDLYKEWKDGMGNPKNYTRALFRKALLIPPHTPVELSKVILNQAIKSEWCPEKELSRADDDIKYGAWFGGGVVSQSMHKAEKCCRYGAYEPGIESQLLKILPKQQARSGAALHGIYETLIEPAVVKFMQPKGDQFNQATEEYEANPEKYVARLMFLYELMEEMDDEYVAIYAMPRPNIMALAEGRAVKRARERCIGEDPGLLFSDFVLDAWPILHAKFSLWGANSESIETNSQSPSNNPIDQPLISEADFVDSF